ncbi:MAG: hypothetical protein ABW061_02045 [Polyangiaceae bacterium]
MRLPCELERYYREVGPVELVIDHLETPFFLPALASLWEFQAGYRWDMVTRQAVAAWNDHWLVVAEHGAEPLIFSSQTARISLAHAANGAWIPEDLFADLNEMACCLSFLGSVLAEADDEPIAEDGEIHLELRRAAEFGLTDLLRYPERAVHVLSVLGWS